MASLLIAFDHQDDLPYRTTNDFLGGLSLGQRFATSEEAIDFILEQTPGRISHHKQRAANLARHAQEREANGPSESPEQRDARYIASGHPFEPDNLTDGLLVWNHHEEMKPGWSVATLIDCSDQIVLTYHEESFLEFGIALSYALGYAEACTWSDKPHFVYISGDHGRNRRLLDLDTMTYADGTPPIPKLPPFEPTRPEVQTDLM